MASINYLSLCNNACHVRKNITVYPNNSNCWQFCELCDINIFHDPICPNIYKPIHLKEHIQSDPNSTSKTVLLLVLRELLNICENVTGPEKKGKYAYIIYEWLSKNLWFMEQHSRFRDTVQSKLNEFRLEPNATHIIEKYGWMEHIRPPFGNITSSGRIVKKPRIYWA